jgi:hypothetical protein
MVERLAIGTALSFSVLLAGCDQCASWQPEVDGLQVLEKLDPAEMAERAISRGDLSVLAVHGHEERVPGIPDQECALTRIRKRVIDPTPEVFCSPEHHRLKRLAVAYAERYNAVIRGFRRSKGLPSCDA